MNLPHDTLSSALNGTDVSDLRVNASVQKPPILDRTAVQAAEDRKSRLSDWLLDSMPEIFFVVGEQGQVIMCNPYSRRELGLGESTLLGLSLSDFVVAKDKAPVEAMLTDVFEHGKASCDADFVFSDQKIVPHYLVSHRVHSEEGPRAIIVGLDITIRRQAEQKNLHLAMHDVLTGLPNRAMLHECLEKSLAIAKRQQKSITVLFLDLDNFKPINDQAGHAVGDVVLREIAHCLVQTLRDSDTVFRYGGDEFVVVLSAVANDQGAADVAANLVRAVSRPIDHNDHNYQVGASIGISTFPAHASSVSQLLASADAAMYQAKKHGKGWYEFANLQTCVSEKAQSSHNKATNTFPNFRNFNQAHLVA